MKRAAWINLIGGIWLVIIAVASATSFTSAATANDVGVGLLLAGTAWWLLATAAIPAAAVWLQMGCGAWLIVAPSVLGDGYTTAPMTSAVAVGLVAIIVSLLELRAVVERPA